MLREKIAIITLLSTLALTTTMGVKGADWQDITTNNNEAIHVLMAKDTLQLVNNTTKKIWIMEENKDNRVLYLYQFTLDGKYRVIDKINPMLKKQEEFRVTEWRNVVPETYEEKVYNYVWKKKERKNPRNNHLNKWEQKGENVKESIANRYINKVLQKIG